MSERGRLLVLWNQTEEDIYETWRNEGPKALEWDPNKTAPDVGTVAEEMAGFIQALKEGGFEVHLVNVEDDLERVISSIRLIRPDAVFNLVEYFNDDQVQEAYIAGLYEMLGVSYTGNRPICLATCQNKFRTKLILEAAGLPTSPYFRVEPGEELPSDEDHALDYPVIVKPAYEDASGGIEHKSVCQDREQLKAQIAHVFKEFRQPALIEEYIDGREIHAAIMGNFGTPDPKNPSVVPTEVPEVLPLFEMEFDDSEFNPTDEWRPQIISFRAKWDPHSKDFYSMDAVVPPEDLDEETAEYIRDVAARAFQTMGCRDYARIDMRVDEDGEVYILEVNPNPDLVDGAAYMMCAAASGRTYSESLSSIADMAIRRGKEAAAKAAALANELPSDQLMREHVKQKQATATTAPQAATEPAGGPEVAAQVPEDPAPPPETSAQDG